ncbi:putative fungal pheromone GPCR, STE3-type [Gloeopeniophorella convolvens]|nr:putative fungal pheromone GPCR, STE3-type [Gloeopeniophorella convolvens]
MFEPVFPVCALLGAVLVAIPLPWHLEAWNSGTCYFMIWTSVACLNQFVNSMIWRNNALNVAPVWCDISTRIMIGSSVAIPAASMCISRRLYCIATIRAVTVTRAEKLRNIIIDTFICIVLPFVCVALAYVVQGHRFNIFEDIGCFPATVNTALAYVLVYMWPLLLGLISAVYGILSIRAFWIRQAEMKEFLANSSTMTTGRYFRLIALSMTEMSLTTPLSVFVIIFNASGEIQPWISWSNIHFDFSRVELISASLWQPDHGLAASLIITRWLVPLSAFVFFVFFGFGDEALKNYRKCYAVIYRRLYLTRIAALFSFTLYVQVSWLECSYLTDGPRQPLQKAQDIGSPRDWISSCIHQARRIFSRQ